MEDSIVLITGSSGFLGTHLKRKLQDLGATIYSPSHNTLDLLDLQGTMNYFDKIATPDYIFHLAATVGGIQFTREHPASTLYDNLTMGLNLFEARHRCMVGTKLIVAGSVCAYPKYTSVPFIEENLWEGHPEESNGPYGIAKRVLHTALDAYHTEYGIEGVYALMANLYGPGDSFNPSRSHVIPALISNFSMAAKLNADEVEVWGSGNATRDFLYVEDAADALIHLALHHEDTAPINVGSGQELRIDSLAHFIAVACGYTGEIKFDPSKPDGQPRRALNINKIVATGWRPQTSFEQGIAATVDYYRSKYG